MRAILLSLIILSLSLQTEAQDYATLGHSWYNGRCHTVDGKTLSGLIATTNKEYLLFRVSEDSSKIKISLTQLKSYVIGVDSFTMNSKSSCIRVILDMPTKIYSITREKTGAPIMIGGGMMLGNKYDVFDYYYGTNPDSITLIKRKEFKNIMTKIMADKPLVVQKINDKTYELAEIEDLISFYKTGTMPDHEEVETSSE
jgi:hypothetical protein